MRTSPMMRTSPCWTHARRPHLQATSRRQLGLRVRFGFSRQPCTKMAISPSYDIEKRRSLMRWKAYNEMLLLVLVPAPECSWIILCHHNKVLHHLFWANSAFVSCRALSPCCGRPHLVATNPSSPLVFKLSSRHRLDSGFV